MAEGAAGPPAAGHAGRELRPDAAAPAAVVRTAVVTDSAAALPADWVRDFAADGRLTVVPMPVMVGEEIYGEGEDDITETIAVALASGMPVKTSRPSPGQFEQAYRGGAAPRLRSRGLHPYFRRAVRHRRLRPARGRPRRHPRGSGRFRNRRAWRWAWACRAPWSPPRTAGAAAEVRAFAEERLARTKVYFYVPSLEQLRRGGRIGAAASLWGTVLAIKPILAVDDGKIVPLEKVRSGGAGRWPGSRKSWPRTPLRGLPGQARLAVHHFGNPAEAEELAGRLAASLPGCPPAQISSLPAVLAAHAGLGVLAVIVGESSTPARDPVGGTG